MGNGDDLLRAHALISSLHANVPNDYEVEQRWVEEFNSTLERLATSVGRDLEVFKVPTDALARSIGTRSTITEDMTDRDGTEDVTYRDGLWCRREVLIHKVEAVLTYFTGIQTGQDRKIGFGAP